MMKMLAIAVAMSAMTFAYAAEEAPCPTLKAFSDAAAANTDGRQFVVYARSAGCAECVKLEKFMALNVMSIDAALHVKVAESKRGVPMIIPFGKDGRPGRPVVGYEAAAEWIYQNVK